MSAQLPPPKARSRSNEASTEPSSKRRSTDSVSGSATNLGGRQKLEERLRSVTSHRWGSPLTYAMHFGKVPSESKYFKFKSYAFPEAVAAAAAAATTETALTVNNSSFEAEVMNDQLEPPGENEMDQTEADRIEKHCTAYNDDDDCEVEKEEDPLGAADATVVKTCVDTKTALNNILAIAVKDFLEKKKRQPEPANKVEKEEKKRQVDQTEHSTAVDTETPLTESSDVTLAARVEPITELDLTKAISEAIESHSMATNFHSFSEVQVNCPLTDPANDQSRNGRIDILLSENQEKALTAPLAIIEVGLNGNEFWTKVDQIVQHCEGIYTNGLMDHQWNNFNGPMLCLVLTIDGKQVGTLKTRVGVFMCWPKAGNMCRMMILFRCFTTDLKKASCVFGRFLWVAFLLAKYRSGGDGNLDYEYLSSNCCRFGDVSVLLFCASLGVYVVITSLAHCCFHHPNTRAVCAAELWYSLPYVLPVF